MKEPVWLLTSSRGTEEGDKSSPATTTQYHTTPYHVWLHTAQSLESPVRVERLFSYFLSWDKHFGIQPYTDYMNILFLYLKLVQLAILCQTITKVINKRIWTTVWSFSVWKKKKAELFGLNIVNIWNWCLLVHVFFLGLWKKESKNSECTTNLIFCVLSLSR